MRPLKADVAGAGVDIRRPGAAKPTQFFRRPDADDISNHSALRRRAGIIQIPMTVAVGMLRVKTGIQFMDGGSQTLLRVMRAQANFTETVPITLLVMAAAEYTGTSAALLWAGGSSLLLGMIVHYIPVAKYGWGNGRAAGLLLTITALLGFSACILVAYLET